MPPGNLLAGLRGLAGLLPQRAPALPGAAGRAGRHRWRIRAATAAHSFQQEESGGSRACSGEAGSGKRCWTASAQPSGGTASSSAARASSLSPASDKHAGHLELARGALAMAGEPFQLGWRERRRRRLRGFVRPQGPDGAGGPGQQAGVDQALQGLVGRTVNHFEPHGGQRVRLAGAEVLRVQGAKLLAVLRGIALDHDVEDRMRARHSDSAPRSGAARR